MIDVKAHVASRLVAIGAALAMTAGCSSSTEYRPNARSLEWIDRYGYTETEVVDFAFGEQGVWVPIVTAKINNRPARLILDTGTNAYAALDESGFEALEIPIARWSTFLDASGQPSGRIPQGRASTLEVGAARWTDIEIEGLGPESITGKRIGYVGTLGWHALREGRLTIDYANRKAAITERELPARIEACATRHVADFVSPPEIDGLILIQAVLDGREFLAQLETGKSSTLLAPELESIRSFETGDRGLEIDGLRIGPFGLQTRFGRMGRGFDSFSRGVERPVLVGLGSDLLSRFLVTVDYVNRRVILEESDC